MQLRGEEVVLEHRVQVAIQTVDNDDAGAVILDRAAYLGGELTGGDLDRVDLAVCRDQGLQAGYLHLRVTFQESGRVVRAAVESPTVPPPEALACIGEQLKLAMVPGFQGGDVTLSKSFFVNN